MGVVCRTRRTTLVSRCFARLPRQMVVLLANCSASFPQTLPHQQSRRVFGKVDVGSPCAITHDNSANENEAVRCRIKAPLVGKTCTCEKTGLRRYGILLYLLGSAVDTEIVRFMRDPLSWTVHQCWADASRTEIPHGHMLISRQYSILVQVKRVC